MGAQLSMLNLIGVAERGLFPDALVRFGIRRLLASRLRNTRTPTTSTRQAQSAQFAARLRQEPLAIETDKANEQHYEVPAAFYQLVLGPHLKYSCSVFASDVASLAEAEEHALSLTCERAELADGMQILELGCGWGSLTLWMGQRFPGSRITAVSNSSGQRQFIESRCEALGLRNVEAITADIRHFNTAQRFDRVVSIEMFEHLRNYELLLQKISSWLQPDGKLFAHIFCHRDVPYLFETEGAGNWMGRHFFTGGMMPSEDLFSYFRNDMEIEQQWRVNGVHYARTCEAWLANLDANREQAIAMFASLPGPEKAPVAVERWRMFFMACAELFGYAEGNEWFVAHYLMQKK